MAIRPITDTLRHLQGGTLIDEASEALADVVTAVNETGKPGKLTIEIAIKKASRGAGAMVLAGKVSAKKPNDTPVETLMFPTPEGNLLTEDPRQQKLDLKVAPAASSNELKTISQGAA